MDHHAACVQSVFYRAQSYPWTSKSGAGQDTNEDLSNSRDVVQAIAHEGAIGSVEHVTSS